MSGASRHLARFGHEAERASNGRCRVCARARYAKWYASHKEQARARRAANPQPARDRARAWYLANIERALESRRAWRMANRDEVRAYDRARSAANAEYKRERARQWRLANTEKDRERSRRWHAEHPEESRARRRVRRARKRGSAGRHTAADVRAQFDRQKGRCYWCNTSVRRGGWHVDHVIPLARGGTNGPENVVIACARCNLSKGPKMPEEFAGRLL